MTDQTVWHRYSAYGLTIRSQIPLAELASNGTCEGDGEVLVTLGEDPGWISSVQETFRCFRVTRQEAQFWFKGVGAFVVRDGSQIIAIPENGLDHGILRIYIQGMLMAAVLHQRGMCVLHASVLEVNGAALAFLGPVGAGKSSLAAALYSRGHRVLADDNAAISFCAGIPMIQSAYPSLKLFPEIASSLGFRNGALTPLPVSEIKVAGAVPDGFVQKPVRLRALYFLGRDGGSEIAQLTSLQTVMKLIEHSVPTRWGLRGDVQQLQECGSLAAHVPAFALRTFTDLASLPVLAETVEDHGTAVACLGDSQIA